MPRQTRDHVYRSRREEDRCRSRTHDKVWEQATGRSPICDECGRCFWCADPDRCSGRRNSGVESAGAVTGQAALAGSVSGPAPAAPEEAVA